jgi:NhaA family Na+:H+ antiporter
MARKLLPPTAPALPRAIVRPLQEFLATEASGGFVLLVAAAAALAWVNAPFGSTYEDFWGAHVRLDLNVITLDLSLRHWINDGLMALFFYVVGLEIKRELIEGELAGLRRVALPAAAALGGMAVPALIYLAWNAGGAGEHGWGIPMATDIAFAVGVVALVGPRVPNSLKVFLLALAIVDDLGAIVVIAIFYSDGIEFGWLAGAAGIFALVAALGRVRVRSVVVYLAVGAFAWLAVFESGVHATIAGVALGLLTPMRSFADGERFPAATGALVDEYERARAEGGREGAELATAALGDIEDLARESQPVLDRIEHALHPWTSYAVLPVFALANAGIALDGGSISAAVHSRIAAGVALGLMAGKPVGILAFAWAATRLRLAALPAEVRWGQLLAVAIIAGIGFTVSLFISGLAFAGEQHVDDAKMAILAASCVMGASGYAALRLTTRDRADSENGLE